MLFCEDTVDGIGKEVRSRLTVGFVANDCATKMITQSRNTGFPWQGLLLALG